MASAILQVWIRQHTQTPFQGMEAARLHCTPDNVVLLELGRFSSERLNALEDHGFNLHPYWDYSFKPLTRGYREAFYVLPCQRPSDTLSLRNMGVFF